VLTAKELLYFTSIKLNLILTDNDVCRIYLTLTSIVEVEVIYSIRIYGMPKKEKKMIIINKKKF